MNVLEIQDAATLTAMGYRRVSRRYKMIARIDDPDWINKLAVSLRRTPAELYVPGSAKPSGMWCDHYRRCYSKDVLTMASESEFLKVPPSDHDDCGYVEIKP